VREHNFGRFVVLCTVVSFALMVNTSVLRATPVVESAYEGAVCKVSEVRVPFDKALVLCAMAEKFSLAKQQRPAMNLLRQARGLIDLVKTPHDQAWVLANIARGYALAGNLTRALTLFSRAYRVAEASGDERGLGSLYVELAIMCGESGHYEQGLRIARDVEDFWSRTLAISKICQGLIETGEVDRAIAIVDGQVGEPNRTTLKADLARAFAKAGHIKRSLSMVADLTDPIQRSSTTADIVSIVLGSGDKERAKKIAQSLVKGATGLTAMFATGALIEVAAAYEEDMEHAQAFLLMQEARRVAAKIRSKRERAQALADVGTLHSESQQPLRAAWILDDAVFLASTIKPNDHSVDSLVWIANRCLSSGMRCEAKWLVDEAAKRVMKLDSRHMVRDNRLAAVARSYLQMGEFEKAIGLVRRIGSSPLRAQVLGDLNKVALERQRCDIAFNAARTIKFRETKASHGVLAVISGRYVAMERYCDALKVIRWMDDPGLRAIALAELEAQYLKTDHSPSYVEMELIRHIAKPIMMVERPHPTSMDVWPDRRRYVRQRIDPDMLHNPYGGRLQSHH